jgi:hypothetical protein
MLSQLKTNFPCPSLMSSLMRYGAKYFSTLDLACSFHQIRMVIGDEAKTAFKTHHGHF